MVMKAMHSLAAKSLLKPKVRYLKRPPPAKQAEAGWDANFASSCEGWDDVSADLRLDPAGGSTEHGRCMPFNQHTTRLSRYEHHAEPSGLVPGTGSSLGSVFKKEFYVPRADLSIRPWESHGSNPLRVDLPPRVQE